jgi:uncharacterized Rmd1/YagE family protein
MERTPDLPPPGSLAGAYRARPPAGIPEVLSFGLPGRATPAQVRAVLVGSRINTRELEGSIEPQALDATSSGVAFVFRYGAVVLFGASDEIERDFVRSLDGRIIDPVASRAPEFETATLVVRPGDDEQVDAHGGIVLRELTPERLLLVATVLARSVVLGRDEVRIAEVFDRLEPLIAGLQAEGRAVLPISQVMRQIGGVLAARHRMTGRAQIAEKPEILWEHPELDRLYARLEAEFELTERARIIERKLDVIGETASTLLELVQERRSVRLELAVIALIAFEILLTLQERLFS